MPESEYTLHQDEPAEAELTFREQADGRRVSRLPGGKVVLINIPHLESVGDGERWRVRLRHRETFAIADPIERVVDNPLLSPEVAEQLRAGILDRGPEEEAAATGGQAETDEAPATGLSEPQAAEVAAADGGSERSPDSRSVSSAVPASRYNGRAITPDQVVRPDDRVAIFIDGANMDGACRNARYFLDYRKAREFFLAGGMFYAAFYYIADFTSQDPLQQRYLDFLSHAGYIVRRKPVKLIRDQETGERVFKGNLDTEIVLDMMNTADNYDLAFLFSGDSDFERAVELLRSRGKRVYIVTSDASLSRELAYLADKPIFLIEEFEAELRRDP